MPRWSGVLAEGRRTYTAPTRDDVSRTSLSEVERRVVSRFVAALRERHGEDLRAVWLYGSRARARPRREFSDVDLIVLVAGGRGHRLSISRALWDAAEAEGANPFGFSVLVERPEWPEERRAIEDFFIAGVDRDRVTLA